MYFAFCFLTALRMPLSNLLVTLCAIPNVPSPIFSMTLKSLRNLSLFCMATVLIFFDVGSSSSRKAPDPNPILGKF